MRNILLFCVLFLFQPFFSIAQSPVEISIANQYNTLKETVVEINGQSYTTDPKGNVQIVIPATDSLIINSENYTETHVAVADVVSKQKIELHKEFSWKDLLTPMFYIINGGLWLLVFIIFAETGLFAGFFLPGDSLLFVAGIYSTELAAEIPFLPHGSELFNLVFLWILITIAGILGNFVGYWTGRKVGVAMYSWKDNFFFKKQYLHQAHDFFEKNGGGAIIIARFLPFIRTFAPIVAGIVKMDRAKFSFYNIVGCIAWVFSMLFAGHFLQKWILNQFNFDLKEHLEVIVIGIVLVTTLPVIIKLITGKKTGKPA
jgi:membrane-associated protein